MRTPGAVSLTYALYAAVLVIGLGCWFVALFDHLVYARVEAGLLSSSWLDFARFLTRNVRWAIRASLVLVVLATALALWSPSMSDPAHLAQRTHQLRFAAIALLFVGLVSLAGGRMGELDADVSALVVMAWSGWALARGWLALASGASVTGPPGWWLALTADVIGVAAFTAVMIALSRNTRLF